MKYIIIYLVFILSSNILCQNKIIYLIAPPRSTSTVFLRAMYARGDMTIFFQPSQYAFLVKYKPDVLSKIYASVPLFDTYEKVKQALLQYSKEKHVFVKEMSFFAYDALYDDDQFLSNPSIEFCFLIRDPHASIISYYKVRGNKLPPAERNWKAYYEQLYCLFEKITKIRGKVPVVLSSEALTSDPSKIMPLFCKHVGIPFNVAWLQWPSLEHNFDPAVWNSFKYLSYHKAWGGSAIESMHFISSYRNYDVDAQGEPTFIEIEEKDREIVKQVYAYWKQFYTKMYPYRLH